MTRVSLSFRCCCRIRSEAWLLTFGSFPRTSLQALQSAATIHLSGTLPITPRRHTVGVGRIELRGTVLSHRPRTCWLQELQQELGVQFRELLTWEPEPPSIRSLFPPPLLCAVLQHRNRQDAETNGKIQIRSFVPRELSLIKSLTQLTKEDEQAAGDEVEVRREDQDKINKFSRLHQRELKYEEELKAKTVRTLPRLLNIWKEGWRS